MPSPATPPNAGAINFSEFWLGVSFGPGLGGYFDMHCPIFGVFFFFPALYPYLPMPNLTSIWSIWLPQSFPHLLLPLTAGVLMKAFQTSPSYHWNLSRINSTPSLPPPILLIWLRPNYLAFPTTMPFPRSAISSISSNTDLLLFF